MPDNTLKEVEDCLRKIEDLGGRTEDIAKQITDLLGQWLDVSTERSRLAHRCVKELRNYQFKVEREREAEKATKAKKK